MIKMVNSAVESIVIHTFVNLPIDKRASFLDEIQNLCDTLKQGIYEDEASQIRNIINKDIKND